MRFFLFLLLPLTLLAFHEDPWFTRNLQLIGGGHYTFQHYHDADDHFLALSLEGSYENWNGQIDTAFQKTDRLDPGFEEISLLGRYLFMNDVIADPLSIAGGLLVSKASSGTVDDPSTFYHGRLELEGQVSIGKESVCRQFWTSRWWNMAAFGIADHGSPWFRMRAAWEKNFWDCHQFGVEVRGRLGLGNGQFDLDDFNGLGSIRHRSIDAGITYRGGSFEGSYFYRIAASNAPKKAHQVHLTYLYYFSL